MCVFGVYYIVCVVCVWVMGGEYVCVMCGVCVEGVDVVCAYAVCVMCVFLCVFAGWEAILEDFMGESEPAK